MNGGENYAEDGKCRNVCWQDYSQNRSPCADDYDRSSVGCGDDYYSNVCSGPEEYQCHYDLCYSAVPDLWVVHMDKNACCTGDCRVYVLGSGIPCCFYTGAVCHSGKAHEFVGFVNHLNTICYHVYALDLNIHAKGGDDNG